MAWVLEWVFRLLTEPRPALEDAILKHNPSSCAGNAAALAGGSVKRALITGITGQDGSYLTEFLLESRL